MITIVIHITDLPGTKIVGQSIQAAKSDESPSEVAVFDIFQKHFRQALEETSQMGMGGSWAEGNNAEEKAVNRFKTRHGQ